MHCLSNVGRLVLVGHTHEICKEVILCPGKSGVGLVSKAAVPEAREALVAPAAFKTKKRKPLQALKSRSSHHLPTMGALGSISVSQRAMNRSDRCLAS
jgi:hypothetical protein